MVEPSQENWFEWFKRDMENGAILHRQLLRYARMHLGQNAEDAMQDFYLIFPRRARGYRFDIDLDKPISEDSNAAKYVFSSLSRHIIDFTRRNRRYESQLNFCFEDQELFLQSLEKSAFEIVSLEEAKENIRIKVQELPQNYRSVINLVYFNGLKPKDAAKVLEVPISTIKCRLGKGLDILAKLKMANKSAA